MHSNGMDESATGFEINRSLYNRLTLPSATNDRDKKKFFFFGCEHDLDIALFGMVIVCGKAACPTL